MKRKVFVGVGLVVALIVVVVTTVWAASGRADLAKVRKATAQFHRTEAAQATGYDLRSKLDH